MFLFRRFALLLALSIAAASAALAQDSTSSSNPPAATPDQAQAQPQQPAAANPQQGQISVQARIRARRAQRRAAAIHEAYDHLYEANVGMGYLRFTPGAYLQRDHEYAWDAGLTRFHGERLGIVIDARGYFGTAYVYNNAISNSAITNPAISQFAGLGGIQYRFYLLPKFSLSARFLGGVVYGHFSGDLGQYKPAQLGLWPDGYTFGGSGSLLAEYNVTPRVAVRLAPEYFATGFGSTAQGNLGFTAGVAYKFGKQ